jgi:hypothetical protein
MYAATLLTREYLFLSASIFPFLRLLFRPTCVFPHLASPSPLDRWGSLGVLTKATFSFLCRHMLTFEDSEGYRVRAPYQVSPAWQENGKTPVYYFDSVSQKKRSVLRSLTLTVSSADMTDHSPIVVAGSDGLWDNFLGEVSPASKAATNQALSSSLEEIVNDCFQNHLKLDKSCIQELGTGLKNHSRSHMASAHGKPDDLSIFVGTIENNPALEAIDRIRHTAFFDGTDIQDGMEFIQTSSVVPGSEMPKEKMDLIFGTCYFYIQGKPLPNWQRCDDALGASDRCLVLCDGVGGGGPASGKFARMCVKDCLIEAVKLSKAF